MYGVGGSLWGGCRACVRGMFGFLKIFVFVFFDTIHSLEWIVLVKYSIVL